jgi:hypothetical protein
MNEHLGGQKMADFLEEGAQKNEPMSIFIYPKKVLIALRETRKKWRISNNLRKVLYTRNLSTLTSSHVRGEGRCSKKRVWREGAQHVILSLGRQDRSPGGAACHRW